MNHSTDVGPKSLPPYTLSDLTEESDNAPQNDWELDRNYHVEMLLKFTNVAYEVARETENTDPALIESTRQLSQETRNRLEHLMLLGRPVTESKEWRLYARMSEPEDGLWSRLREHFPSPFADTVHQTVVGLRHLSCVSDRNAFL